MATATAFPWFDTKFTVDLGPAAASYKLQQYINGTTTNQATYTNVAGTTPNAFPIILDASGRCTMYGTPGLVYTLVLQDTTGTTVRTWNDVAPASLPVTGTYVPLDGSVAMTGALTLPADPTSALQASTKQYVDAQIAISIASVTALTSAATAAAAAATAAAASITPSHFELYSATGGAVSRTVTLSAGTWAICAQTRAHVADGSVSGSYTGTTTQAFTVGTQTVNTTLTLTHIGGSGYGRDQHGTGLSTGSLVVAAQGTFTMSIAAASLGLMTGTGSVLTLEKQ